MATKKIFDIFSKKSEKKFEKEKLKAIADYREKNSLVPSELINQGVEVDFMDLKVADYIIGNVAIERKTIADFTSSMINKRLLSQLQDLQQYENRLLIIEGFDEKELYNDDNDFGINPNAIRGFLLSIVLKYKVPIIFSKNPEDTARYMYLLLKKRGPELSLNAKKKNLDKKERLQFIMESFPGIGPKTSKKLFKEFKTIKTIINSSQEDLEKILGKKAEIVFRLINEEY